LSHSRKTSTNSRVDVFYMRQIKNTSLWINLIVIMITFFILVRNPNMCNLFERQTGKIEKKGGWC